MQSLAGEPFFREAANGTITIEKGFINSDGQPYIRDPSSISMFAFYFISSNFIQILFARTDQIADERGYFGRKDHNRLAQCGKS